MAATSNYLALDLGAESGRGLLGRFDGELLEMEEVHRFPNGPVRLFDTLHWDLPRLFDEVKTAIRKGAAQCRAARWHRRRYLGGRFRAGRAGRYAPGQPRPLSRRTHERHARSRVSRESPASESTRSPACSSCRSIPSTSFSPWRASRSPLLEVTETLLLMPDLFGWLLDRAPRLRADQRLDDAVARPASKGAWSDELCTALGLPRAILPELIDAGSDAGGAPAVRGGGTRADHARST